MSGVYYKKIDSATSVKEVQEITKQLLEEIIQKEKIVLEKTIPLKVHFGEKGNHTFIKSENYEGIIDFLTKKGINSSYIETNVLYGGQRHSKDVHLKTAADHGFTQLPIIIADGERGENFSEIEINKKHYKTCKLGKEFSNYKQIFVMSHFKGHKLAGFGGAIKQLSMGYASKGGKLEMHTAIKPKIVNRKCKKCNICKSRCNVNAITIADKSFIDHDICIGCGACIPSCPHKAVSIFSLKAFYNFLLVKKKFQERLVEYAYAAHKNNNNNIYVNFAMNVTKGCDCEPKKMKLLVDDFGIFVSSDPVAIDKACYDMLLEKGKKFKGLSQFSYAEKIGLGSTKYELISLN